MAINYRVPDGYTARYIDEQILDIQYIGYNIIDELTTSENWSIIKVDTTTLITNITYAYGSWDNRLSLTYK